MSRCIFCVTSFLILWFPGKCLFAGDGCLAGEKLGKCELLSECQPLLTEIRRAGSPMPIHMRRKLQSLSCGFEFDQPLVCCARPPSFPSDGGGNAQPWSTNSPQDTAPQTSRPSNNFPDDDDNRDNNANGSSPPDIRGHRNLRLLPTECGVIENDRIFGGNRTSLFEMPWMVLIAYDSARGTKLSCGGTLITERYVLTAAHCVSFLGSRLTLANIILGEYDVRKDPDCERVEGVLNCAPSSRNASIEAVIPHPGYTPQTLFDDIALVRLRDPADFSQDNMKPICLPTTSELQTESLVGMQGTVAGWGATEDGLQSPVLLSVALPIVGNKECQDAYNGSPQILNKQMCAGGVQDRDSCGGDSGGPLMYPGRIGNGGVRYVQRGIVSYGSKRCGIGGFPGVYTRVSYYMDWILDNIRN